MKLYENVAIGNFLYGLGFAVGKRVKGSDFPSAINLLQQTPDDTLFGDVLIRAPGMLRIFEFKQRGNNESKEPLRHAKLKEHLKGKDALILISRTVHWFIETAPDEKSFFSRIVPYLDAYPKTDEQHSFAEFVNTTADAVVGNSEPLPQADIGAYLAHLLHVHNSEGAGSGCLIVKMSETGELHYAELTSILDLTLTKKSILEKQMARMQEQGKIVENEQKRGFEHER